MPMNRQQNTEKHQRILSRIRLSKTDKAAISVLKWRLFLLSLSIYTLILNYFFDTLMALFINYGYKIYAFRVTGQIEIQGC